MNAAPVRPDNALVLYWMIAARRSAFNFALDRAVAWARELNRALVILEPLRVDYPFASGRFHRFVIDGMASNASAFSCWPVLYYPYVERRHGAGRGLLERLASEAAVVVTDAYPCFFPPRVVAEALAIMVQIMNRWSLDGRDPAFYAGYLWTLWRYDRPWPERPIFGKVRSMSSTRTARRCG